VTDLFFHHGLHQSQPRFPEQVADSLLQQAYDLGQWQHHLDVRVLFGRDPAELLHGSLLFDLVLFLQATLSFFLAENSPSLISTIYRAISCCETSLTHSDFKRLRTSSP